MRFAICFVCFLAVWPLHGQIYKGWLHGKLTMQTGEVFTYNLELTDSQGFIKGYSYTYDAPEDTKSMIRGTLDRQRGLLAFKEVDIDYSHNKHPMAFMCLIHAKLQYTNGKISGPVTSQELDRTACTPGSIVFSDATETGALFGSRDKYDVAVEMGGRDKRRVVATPEIPVKPSEKKDTLEKITTGTDKEYTWMSDSLVLEIWDGGTVDGDVVTVFFDGKPVIDRAKLFSAKRTVTLYVDNKRTHTLAIQANEEGSDPPATATVRLIDGATKYNLLAYNNKNASSIIKIKRLK